MRKQFHFWPGEHGYDAWDVDRLVELTAGLPTIEVGLDELPDVDAAYWYDETSRPTVRSVVEHLRLVRDADPSYPIILGPGNRVMDGMHRVAKAMLEGRRTIAARRLTTLPPPDHLDVTPADLPTGD